MLIEKISLRNVRNFSNYLCEFSPGINLVYGKNGKGKTTILEAIYSMSMGKSFKNGPRKNLIKFEEDSFLINGRVKTETGKTLQISVACSGDRYKISVDKKVVISIMDLIDVFPVVVMAPENIELIDGTGVIRRNFFDRLISIVDKQYMSVLKEYNRILRQRKILLWEKNEAMIQLWSEKMADSGLVLWDKRKQSFHQFSELFANLWPSELNHFIGETKYLPKSANTKEEFLYQLQKVKKQELIRKANLYGPHKDDFLFLINRVSARYFASQGEKKLFLTVLKNTECKFIQHYLRKPPILLLDDLLAKLDNDRGLNIMEMLRSNNQAIITSTDQAVIEILNQSQVKINTIQLV